MRTTVLGTLTKTKVADHEVVVGGVVVVVGDGGGDEELLNCYSSKRKIVVREADLSEKKSSSIFIGKKRVFHAQEICHFSLGKRGPQNGVSFIVVGFFWKRVTFLMSSSRLLRNSHGNR